MLSVIAVRNLFIRFLKENRLYHQFISFGDGHLFEGISIIEYLNRPIYMEFIRHIDVSSIQHGYIESSFDWDLYNEISWFEIDSDWKLLYEYIGYGKSER